MSFKVACVQNCAADDMQANLDELEKFVLSAVSAGAELVCLPENCTCIEQHDALYLEKGFAEDEHPGLARLRAVAGRAQVYLLIGSLTIKRDRERVRNRSYLVDPEGKLLARYDKVHLFDVELKDGEAYRESATVEPGGELQMASLPWGKMGLTICYDIRFPHLYRALAHAGAYFLSIPAAFTATTGAAHWHVLCRARAIENASYVFAPGQCGKRPWGRRTYGHSLVVDPWGEVLADGGDEPGYIIADVSPAKIEEARAMIPSLHHDREFA